MKDIVHRFALSVVVGSAILGLFYALLLVVSYLGFWNVVGFIVIVSWIIVIGAYILGLIRPEQKKEEDVE